MSGENTRYNEHAIQVVAKATGIAQERLTVVKAEEVVWRDSSMGCPQPGGRYLMALTPGMRIVVKGEGQTFFVHGNRSGRLFVCDKPQTPYVGET